MSFWAKIVDAVGGGIFGTAADLIKSYFPPDMTAEQKAELQLKLAELEHQRDMEAAKLAHEVQTEFDNRIRDLEGTAADLKTIPIIGPLLILVRGAQRPLWGFATMWFDYQIFSHSWVLDDQQKAMLFAVNILVLGFLFGERAAKNVLPLVGQFFGAKMDKES